MVVSAAGGDDERVRFGLGEGRGGVGMRGEVGWQEERWDPEERLGNWGWWSNPPRSKSAALPHFYCLIYTPSDHIGSSLVEICGGNRRSSEQSRREENPFQSQ